LQTRILRVGKTICIKFGTDIDQSFALTTRVSGFRCVASFETLAPQRPNLGHKFALFDPL